MSVAIASSHRTIALCEVRAVIIHDERSSGEVPTKLDIIRGEFSVLEIRQPERRLGRAEKSEPPSTSSIPSASSTGPALRRRPGIMSMPLAMRAVTTKV